MGISGRNCCGVVGSSHNLVEKSANFGNISVDTYCIGGGLNPRVAGFVGFVYAGEVKNCYANCKIDYKKTKYGDDSVAGFAGVVYGKVINCYSDVDIISKDMSIPRIAGFAGQIAPGNSQDAVVNKCFAMGSIVTEQKPTYCGYFAAVNTGAIQTGVYSDALTMNLKTTEINAETGESVEVLTALEPTCAEGELKAQSELLSVNFLENTLYFDRMIWFLVEGELPTLR